MKLLDKKGIKSHKSKSPLINNNYYNTSKNKLNKIIKNNNKKIL